MLCDEVREGIRWTGGQCQWLTKESCANLQPLTNPKGHKADGSNVVHHNLFQQGPGFGFVQRLQRDFATQRAWRVRRCCSDPRLGSANVPPKSSVRWTMLSS